MKTRMQVVTIIRQQQAAAAGRQKRSEGLTPSIVINKDRITLPRLRFMGEEPDPRYADFR